MSNPFTASRSFLMVGLAITTGVPSALHAFEIEKYWPQYAAFEPELSKKYLQNKKFRTATKSYTDVNWNDKLVSESTSTIICSQNSVRVDSVTQMVDRTDKVVRGMMFDQDELYYLEKVNGKYTVQGHRYNAEDKFELHRILSGYRYAAPLSFIGKLDLRRQFQNFGDGRFLALHPTPKPIEKATLEGKPTLKLTVLSQADHSYVAYYDPNNSGALLRYETSHTFDIQKMKSVAIREIGTITYVDSPLGYPVPKMHKCWYQKPDGTVIRQFEVEYLEYENYTPKADDFDLEKQYGIKPLPRPASAGPAPEGKSTFANTNSGWGRWLWIAAGVLAVVTAVLFVVVWRKRRMNRGAPEST